MAFDVAVENFDGAYDSFDAAVVDVAAVVVVMRSVWAPFQRHALKYIRQDHSFEPQPKPMIPACQ